MFFVDYIGLNIELSEEVWTEHIKAVHPEICEADIKNTLSDPDEVWVSQKREDTELYYSKKENLASGKNRYWMIAVKKIKTGNFISSAMTKSTIIGSKLIYKKL
ncbi:MAG TPA: hypothetical protein PLJ21_02245 [Pseudobdellovibrionaceae bacterium]|nr:hypothetical protein [Pseudobdellovibrionaceae bacterium]